jgi:hypothetical protein
MSMEWVYGDVITNQESEALAKIARLALTINKQTVRGKTIANLSAVTPIGIAFG